MQIRLVAAVLRAVGHAKGELPLGDNEEPPEPPKPKMMSSRLKMLPKPPSEAEKTDDPIAKMRAELEEATKAAAPSGTTCFGTTVEMKSSRLRMLHKPSTANAAAGEGGAPSGDEPQPSLNVESLKDQIAKMRAAGAMPGVPKKAPMCSA